jgi:hypothetical protein
LAQYTWRLWTESVRSAQRADAAAAQQARDTQAALALAKTSADAAALNAEIAQKSLYLLHRPYVVRAETVDCGVELFMHGKSDAIIGCIFINRGMTHAILVELYMDLVLVPMGGLPLVLDPARVSGDMYPPSRLIPRDIPQRFDIQIAQHVQLMDVRSGLMERKRSLGLYGFMRYRDIFGQQYRHGFCGRYDSAKNDFVIAGGAQYNYSDEDRVEKTSQANRVSLVEDGRVAVLRSRRT